MIPLAVVLGPTGSGKSELAIQIALKLGGEIVNCDSLQIYKGFDIGTAKVPIAARQGVPHHLIDIADPTALFTAGEYARMARRTLHEIAGRRQLPIVVGGTGFYLRALLEGLFPGPERNAAIRANLEQREQRRKGSLHRILSRLDPAAAARIHSNDKNKIVRALEVRLLEGQAISEAFERGREPLQGFQVIKIGLNPARDLLYKRLNDRGRRMFEAGLIEEVQNLLTAGVPHNAKPFESLGYKQALAVLERKMTSEQAVVSTQLETRRYAKRQLTWFRKEHGVRWLNGFGDDRTIQQQAIEIARETITNINR